MNALAAVAGLEGEVGHTLEGSKESPQEDPRPPGRHLGERLHWTLLRRGVRGLGV